MDASSPARSIDQAELLLRLDEKMNLADAVDLAFYLHVDWDNLRGDGKRARLRDLLDYCQRHNRLAVLQHALRTLRPDVLAEDEAVIWVTAPPPKTLPTVSLPDLRRWLAILLAFGLVLLALSVVVSRLRANARSPQAYLDEARDLYYHDDFDRALTAAQAAINRDPGLGAAYTLAGIILSHQGNSPKALDYLTQAINLGPDVEAREERGELLLGLGEWDRAIADFTVVLTLASPTDLAYRSAYLGRAKAYIGQHDLDKARNDVQRYLDLPVVKASPTEQAQALPVLNLLDQR